MWCHCQCNRKSRAAAVAAHVLRCSAVLLLRQ
jgi:hypothetical protein